MIRHREIARRAITCCIVLCFAACSDPSGPKARGTFEADLQGALDLELRGTAGFAQTDSVAPIAFQISLSKTIRDTTYYIVMDIPTGRPPAGVYSVLGGTSLDPDFHLSIVICNETDDWCSYYVPHDGLINLTASSPTKVSGVFNGVVEIADPDVTQEILVDGAFDALCDRTLLRPAAALCR